MGRTRPGSTESEVYAKSLSADCDLDLEASDTVLVRDTLTSHYDHLCHIIFKCITKLWVGQEWVSLKSMHKV